MRTPTFPTFSILAVLAAMAAGLMACSNDENPPPMKASSLSASSSPGDPCAIALFAQPAESAEIRRYQDKARSAKDPAPYLERLGWAFVARARRSFDPGDYALAEQAALCIDRLKPGTPEAMLLRGHVLDAEHRFREAEAIAAKLVATRGLAFDHGLYGDALMEQGKLDQAVEAYQAMMDLRPGPEAYSRGAHVRWLMGDLPGAIALMKMAAGAGGAGDAESTAWAYARLAHYALQAGDLDGARRSADEALALVPGYAPALLAQGRVLMASGRNAEAVAPLTQAVRANPLPDYQWTLIEALLAADRPAEAAPYEAALASRGAADDSRTYALYLATRRLEPQVARDLASRELETRQDPFTFDAVAWAAYADGDVAAAETFMGKGLAAGTADARLFLHAGLIAAAAGRPTQARRYLTEARTMQLTLQPSERALLDESFPRANQRSSTTTSRQGKNSRRIAS